MQLLYQLLYTLQPFLVNVLPIIAVLVFTSGAFYFFYHLVKKYMITEEYVELKKPGILFVIAIIFSLLIFGISLLAINIPPTSY